VHSTSTSPRAERGSRFLSLFPRSDRLLTTAHTRRMYTSRGGGGVYHLVPAHLEDLRCIHLAPSLKTRAASSRRRAAASSHPSCVYVFLNYRSDSRPGRVLCLWAMVCLFACAESFASEMRTCLERLVEAPSNQLFFGSDSLAPIYVISTAPPGPAPPSHVPAMPALQ
jgi:hypothetical protein